jgi:hypothetical protein
VRAYLQKSFTKIGLVEWFNVKALYSTPVQQKERKKTVLHIKVIYDQILHYLL